MISARAHALLPIAAFIVLAVVLAALGEMPATWTSLVCLAVAAGFGPSGWLAPGGWRRRAAESSLLAVGLAFTLVADLTLRQMALPPLLLLAAGAALAAAWRRAGPDRLPVLLAGFALATTAATMPVLIGFSPALPLLALVAAPLLTLLVARRSGPVVALSFTLAGVCLSWLTPLEHLAALVVLAGVVVIAGQRLAWIPVVSRIVPALASLGLAMSTLSSWPHAPLPALANYGWSVLILAAALLLAPRLPPIVVGAGWLTAALAIGAWPVLPVDQGRVVVGADLPRVALPRSNDTPYLVEIALDHAGHIDQGTVVARIRANGSSLPVRAGIETAEWAHERPDVRSSVRHGLPARPRWRPVAGEAATVWGVAGCVSLDLPATIVPVIERDPALPSFVGIIVTAAGPVRATPPRDWPFLNFLLAAAAAVLVVQLAAASWREPAAWLPWMLLTAGAVAAQIPVAPLAVLVERHGVDLAMAAFLAAWVPAARHWLAAGKVFCAAAALLIPLAIATPHLTPPLYGDEPFHLLVLEALTQHHTTDLTSLGAFPSDRMVLHSPVLACLLLPGYLALGRTGALLELAIVGALVAVFVARRLADLGIPASRRALASGALLLGTLLPVYATQIWVEIPAALAAIVALDCLTRRPPGRLATTLLAVLATAVKTRLALLSFPIAAAAWLPRRIDRRHLAGAMAALAIAAAAALAIAGAFLGHPFGRFRTVADLVPTDVRQAAISLGGLLFDPSGGLAFAMPLVLAGFLAGSALLWRRGGPGERALITGLGATVVMLLPAMEWSGGGSPPARYLMPFLPLAVLGLGEILTRPLRWRPALLFAAPLGALWWWVLVTRPHFSINPNNGSNWLADALARRFSADALVLFPSFLRPSLATVVVPVALVVGVVTVGGIAAWWPGAIRSLARGTVGLWLVGAAALIVVVALHFDSRVELENAQIRHFGGRPQPREGTWATFAQPNGWRVAAGEGIEVPLHLPAGTRVRLQGWIDGAAPEQAGLRVGWDGMTVTPVEIRLSPRGGVALPTPEAGGRHRVRITFAGPPGSSAVFDRIEVDR